MAGAAGGAGSAPGAAPREIELKLAVPPAALPLLRQRLARLGHGRVQQLETVYLDSADRLLARHGMALRLRRVGRRWLQTLKTGDARAAFAQRGEWEMPAPGGRLDLERLAGTPLPALLAAHDGPALQPQFSTRFERRLWRLRFGAARIEVALDAGEIVAGARREPLLELELELKAGPAAALFALARRLAGEGRARALPLLPFTESKAARGHRLAAGLLVQPRPVDARELVAGLAVDASAEAALRQVLLRGTEAWLANVHGVLASDDPEFVHQARVALRRMRSALRLWQKAAGLPAALAVELEWIGDVLGAARDADVLATATLPALGAVLPPRAAAALRRLLPAMRARQAAARDAARTALASGRAARLALALLQWGAAPAVAQAPDRAAAAARALRRAARRVGAAARAFATLPASERHRLRRRLKRYRDALDLLDGIVPAKPAARARCQLARLNDLLGALADALPVDAALAAVGAAPLLRRQVAAAQQAAAGPRSAAAVRALRALRPAAARMA